MKLGPALILDQVRDGNDVFESEYLATLHYSNIPFGVSPFRNGSMKAMQQVRLA